MAKARRLQATWTPSSTRVRLSSRMGPVTRRIRLMSVRLLHSTICAVLPVSLSTLTSRSRTLASLVRVSRASRSRPTAPVGRHFVREAEQQHAGDGEQRRQQLHQLRVREGGLVHVQKVGAVGEGDHDEADGLLQTIRNTQPVITPDASGTLTPQTPWTPPPSSSCSWRSSLAPRSSWPA